MCVCVCVCVCLRDWDLGTSWLAMTCLGHMGGIMESDGNQTFDKGSQIQRPWAQLAKTLAKQADPRVIPKRRDLAWVG